MLLIDEKFLITAHLLVESATTSIDISTFKAELTEKPRGKMLRSFFDVVFEKRANGIPVRFLLNWNRLKRLVPASNKPFISACKNRKVDIRILPNDRCCHAKIILVDHQAAIIGSHNLSVASCHRNFEISYISYEKVITESLQTHFDHVFKQATRP